MDTTRDLFITNVERLMEEHPEKGSPDKLAKYCRWPVGNSKAGKRIAPRTIRYALERARNGSVPPSPTLDVIAAIAEAFGIPPALLLADTRIIRLYQLGKLFTMSEAVSDTRVEEHLPLPPTSQQRSTTAERRRKKR